jgi:hypothetical protein
MQTARSHIPFLPSWRWYLLLFAIGCYVGWYTWLFQH